VQDFTVFKFLRNFWPKRAEVLAEADEFMEFYGAAAYSEARAKERKAREAGDRKRERFLSRVRREIAKRTDLEIGLDTATRYLEDKQAPYDPGPGMVRKRPDGATLH
jgi:hypothetical protein